MTPDPARLWIAIRETGIPAIRSMPIPVLAVRQGRALPYIIVPASLWHGQGVEICALEDELLDVLEGCSGDAESIATVRRWLWHAADLLPERHQRDAIKKGRCTAL